MTTTSPMPGGPAAPGSDRATAPRPAPETTVREVLDVERDLIEERRAEAGR
jgi:hypothetical protein